MKRLCTICARGGSKGVPSKNIREIAGAPLISHSIRQAQQCGLFDFVAVSSDSAEILDIAQAEGVDLVIERPAELATDSAAKLPVIKHAVETAEAHAGATFETLVDLDATSPLRNADDIRACVEMIETGGAGCVITAMPSRRSPYFNLIERHENGLLGPAKSLGLLLIRRQDAPDCYDMNASIYAWERDRFMRDPSVFEEDTQLYVMPLERSWDIDEEIDFEIVRFLMERNGPAI